MVYRIGTRRSPLALKQVEEVVAGLKKFYPGIEVEVISIDTYGDKDKVTHISDVEGTDFFTREIDEALLNNEVDTFGGVQTPPFRAGKDYVALSINPEQTAGFSPRFRRIDFAVHSAKDLPDEIPKGLLVAAITKSIDPFDALVSKGNLKIDQLRAGAKIGSSSQRRKQQLEIYRPDFNLIDIRGNIQERLDLLGRLDLDAVIVAACALKRLGLEDRIAERIPLEILQPHPLQGSLAIVAREGDKETINLFRKLDTR